MIMGQTSSIHPRNIKFNLPPKSNNFTCCSKLKDTIVTGVLVGQ
jgi:hypothetical protein